MTKRNLVNKAKKSTKIFVAAALMAAMAAQPVMAATTISSVSVKLNIDLQDGDDLPDLDIGHTDSDSKDTLEVMIPSNNKYDIVDAEGNMHASAILLSSAFSGSCISGSF